MTAAPTFSRTAYRYDRFFIEYTFTGLKQYADFAVGFQWERTPKNSYDSFPLVGIKMIRDRYTDAAIDNVIWHTQNWELFVWVKSYSKEDNQDYLQKLSDLIKLFVYEHPHYLHTYGGATFTPYYKVWIDEHTIEFGTMKYHDLLLDTLTVKINAKWQEAITISSTPLIDLPDPTSTLA